MKLSLKSKRELQGGVTQFVFSAEEPISWKAGQYIHYTLPHEGADDRGTERWFTISNAPCENDPSITTRISPENGSSFKKHLSQLQVGETIEADSPEGDFVLDGYDKDYVFVVGGIGITPFISMLTQMEHDGQGANIEILYANRIEATKAYKDELEAVSTKHADINVADFYGDHKITQADLEAAGAKLHDPIYYISGPEPMVEAFEKVLDAMGVDDSHKRFDYFPGYDDKSQ